MYTVFSCIILSEIQGNVCNLVCRINADFIS